MGNSIVDTINNGLNNITSVADTSISTATALANLNNILHPQPPVTGTVIPVTSGIKAGSMVIYIVLGLVVVIGIGLYLWKRR